MRHNAKLGKNNWHKAAEEGNYFLRGFNYLFIMKKVRERQKTRPLSQPTAITRSPHARPDGRERKFPYTHTWQISAGSFNLPVMVPIALLTNFTSYWAWASSHSLIVWSMYARASSVSLQWKDLT